MPLLQCLQTLEPPTHTYVSFLCRLLSICTLMQFAALVLAHRGHNHTQHTSAMAF
jgi:hypothetical protein